MMNYQDCVFCKIAAGDIPSTRLYQDEDVVAFRDLHPQAPVHILIIPRKHIASVAEMNEEDVPLLGKICLVAKALAEQEGIAESGYRLIANTRKDSGQEVPHLHFHLIGGCFLGPFTSK